MAEYRDPTPISPKEPEYDKSKVSKEVANYTQQVREKKKGHDVRESLARNSEIADIKAEDAVATSYNTKARQDDVENRFDDQIAGNTDIDEVVDARRPEGEEAYPTLRRRLDEEHQEVTAQLAQKTTDVYNAGSEPSLVSDFSGTINRLFLEYDKLFVPKNEYNVSGEVQIPEGKILDLGNSTLHFQTNETKIVLERGSFFDNFTLDVSHMNGYTGDALVVDGSIKHSTISNTEIGKGAIRNTSAPSGRALFLDATSVGSAIVNLKIGKLTIYGFKYGLYGDSTLSGTYINGNSLSNISFYDCETFIYLDGVGGSGMDNNTMENIYIQPGSNSKLGVYIGGHRNHFKGSLWDVGHFPGFVGFEFSPFARENKIFAEGGQPHVRNNNGTNAINGLYGGDDPHIHVTGAGKVQAGDARTNLRNYIGNQDNVLANGDKKYDFAIEGPLPNSQSGMFSTNPNTYSTFSDLNANDTITIEIDLTNDLLRYSTVIGAIFVFMNSPDYIKIEAESPSGTIYDVLEEKNFKGGYIYAPFEADSISKIRYTFSKKEGTRIDVSKLFAGGLGTRGNHFIDTLGGNVYGNLTFDQGKGVVLRSPNGSEFILRVDDNGELSTGAL